MGTATIRITLMLRWRSLLLLLTVLPALAGADWPHRNGPYRNNTTTEVVSAWKKPLEVAWHIPLGEGYSSPTVADGRLFLHAKVKDKNEEEILAFDAATGKPLWRVAYPHAPFESNVGNGPRGAPCIALGRVYAYGITGILTCLKADTGEQLWQTNPLEKLGASIMIFGASAGPLVDGNRLYLPVGGPGSALVALDARTGEMIWKSLDAPSTSVTPLLVTAKIEGRAIERQVLNMSPRGLQAVAPSDGSLLWEFGLFAPPLGTVPPAIAVGDMLVASSMFSGTFALRLGEQDGRIVPREVWRNSNVTCYFTQAVPVGDEIYILNATLIPEADIALSCLDAKTGQELWKKTKIGVYQLNLIRTGDNKLLALDDTHGDLILIDANRKEYRELARSKVCKPTIISPALANGRVYTRDDEGVKCYDLKASADQ
jgi:outer membrane protein assembly factor BamB